MGITQSTGSRQHSPGECEDRAHFVWDFFLPLVFVAVALQVLMDSYFPYFFPIIQYTFPNSSRHGLSQQVRHHLQLCFASGEGQAQPLCPVPPLTSLSVMWAAALTPNCSVG